MKDLRRPLHVVAILAATFVCGSCDQQKDWTLFAYPSGDGGFAIITPGFRTLEMCKFAGQEAIQSYGYFPGVVGEIAAGKRGRASFECGRNCKVHKGGTVAVCADTVD